MTDSSPPVRITALTAADLAEAQQLSAALKWPYREDDWAFALRLGHGIAAESAGRLVGTALWWPYESHFATCGMIIVSNACQQRGIGGLLMDELLRQSQGRRMLLCSTRAGRRLYERLGFVATGHVRQHQAVLAAAPASSPVEGVRPFRAADLSALIALDRRAAGMGRDRLLHALLEIGRFAVLERSGRLTGYTCFRRWGRGFVIGPVVAADARDAKTLIGSQLVDQIGQFVRIDATEACGLSPWLSEIGLTRVDEVTTMVRGDAPPTSADSTVFALANQSFG